MTYEKLTDDLKEVQTNLYLICNRLKDEYKEDNIMFDVATILTNEVSNTYRHIAQLLYIMENGGNKVITPILDK